MKILALEVYGNCPDEVLSFLSDQLMKENLVKEHYKESLLEREKKHPTGLCLADSVNVAISHTDVELVNKDAIVIGMPKNEVKFARIDDPSRHVIVDLIFLFVIKDPQKYLGFLSRLTKNFANKEFLKYMKERDLKKIKKFLMKYVL
jgi:PTS system galactitol-specific IIA component